MAATRIRIVENKGRKYKYIQCISREIQLSARDTEFIYKEAVERRIRSELTRAQPVKAVYAQCLHLEQFFRKTQQFDEGRALRPLVHFSNNRNRNASLSQERALCAYSRIVCVFVCVSRMKSISICRARSG